MTFPGTLFFQTVKLLLFLLKQTSYEDIYHFLAATAGYVLSGVLENQNKETLSSGEATLPGKIQFQ